jgi:hypothetical protein
MASKLISHHASKLSARHLKDLIQLHNPTNTIKKPPIPISASRCKNKLCACSKTRLDAIAAGVSNNKSVFAINLPAPTPSQGDCKNMRKLSYQNCIRIDAVLAVTPSSKRSVGRATSSFGIT